MFLQEFDLSSMFISKVFVEKIVDNIVYNNTIYDYYYKLASKVNTKKEFFSLINKADRLKDCNALWYLDKYRHARVKDFKKTNLCRDRFCANCKKVRQAQRINNFLDLFQKHDDDLYFITFTVPNCGYTELKNTIKKIYAAYDKLLRYFKNEVKLFDKLGIDFGEFEGSLRSLEVSFKLDGRNRFHPHIHCAFVLKNYKPTKAYIKNRYSEDHTGRRELRMFTRENVYLQKIWRLLYEGNKVTLDSIDNLKYGYSVTIDKFAPGQYKEMFKYMIKDKDMSGNDMDYKTFEVLYYELLGIRQIQGTGIFKNIKEDMDFTLEDQVDNIYSAFIYALKQKESPVSIQETPQDILNDKSYIYISRKKIFSFLRKSMLEENFTDKIFNVDNNNEFINYELLDTLINNIVSEDEEVAKKKRKEFLDNEYNYNGSKYIVI